MSQVREPSCEPALVVLHRGKDLIRKLLEVNPTKRLTASEALQHEWIAGGMEEDKLPDLSTTRAKLRKKESRHHFRVSQPHVPVHLRLVCVRGVL